jgi:hypothetical protein
MKRNYRVEPFNRLACRSLAGSISSSGRLDDRLSVDRAGV